MADINFTTKSIVKLMDIVDNYKNTNELDDITYIEISNAIKVLFDRSKNHYDESDTNSISSLGSFSDSDLSISDSNNSHRRGTVVGTIRWG